MRKNLISIYVWRTRIDSEFFLSIFSTPMEYYNKNQQKPTVFDKAKN